MNRTLTSPSIVASPSLQRAYFFIALLRLAHLEAPTPLHRGESSGDLTDFSSTNGALRAVKGTQEGDESQVDLTRHCGKFFVTTSVVLHRVWLTWKHPRRCIEVRFQVT